MALPCAARSPSARVQLRLMEGDFVLINKEDLSCRDPEVLIPCPAAGDALSTRSEKAATECVWESVSGSAVALGGSGRRQSDVDSSDAGDSEAVCLRSVLTAVAHTLYAHLLLCPPGTTASPAGTRLPHADAWRFVLLLSLLD